MKKVTQFALAGSLLFTSFVQTGCFGEFALTRKIWGFNKNISDSGFVQTIVMYVLMFIPVYSIAGFLDLVIFNLIEFWAGSNPLAMKEGETEKQEINYAGVNYEMKATKNMFSITVLDGKDAGKSMDLIFTPETAAWSARAEGQTVEICHMVEVNGETIARFTLPNGDIKDFAVNENNLAVVKNYALDYAQMAKK